MIIFQNANTLFQDNFKISRNSGISGQLGPLEWQFQAVNCQCHTMTCHILLLRNSQLFTLSDDKCVQQTTSDSEDMLAGCWRCRYDPERENILGSTARLSRQKSTMSTSLLEMWRYRLAFASSRLMGSFGTYEKVAIPIPTVTWTLPIPIFGMRISSQQLLIGQWEPLVPGILTSGCSAGIHTEYIRIKRTNSTANQLLRTVSVLLLLVCDSTWVVCSWCSVVRSTVSLSCSVRWQSSSTLSVMTSPDRKDFFTRLPA